MKDSNFAKAIILILPLTIYSGAGNALSTKSSCSTWGAAGDYVVDNGYYSSSCSVTTPADPNNPTSAVASSSGSANAMTGELKSATSSNSNHNELFQGYSSQYISENITIDQQWTGNLELYVGFDAELTSDLAVNGRNNGGVFQLWVWATGNNWNQVLGASYVPNYSTGEWYYSGAGYTAYDSIDDITSINGLSTSVLGTLLIPDTLVGQSVNIKWQKNLRQDLPGSIDASNTASIQIDIQEGFTFTAESEDFLSARNSEDPGNTIPEPSALALMGLGLAGIGFARKRKTA